MFNCFVAIHIVACYVKVFIVLPNVHSQVRFFNSSKTVGTPIGQIRRVGASRREFRVCILHDIRRCRRLAPTTRDDLLHALDRW